MKYILFLFVALPYLIFAQEQRPETFFREDFKETPPEIPITQDHIANSDLIISLYGEGADLIKKSNHDQPDDDPYYVWSGLCEDNWAVSLKHKSKNVDLSKQAKIRWRSKQSGFRELHIILKLSDGTWLISDATDALSKDWRIKEFNIEDIQWMSLDIATMTEKKWIENPDLTNVVEIGWTDLMKGGGSEACSRVDWIEVDGYSVRR